MAIVLRKTAKGLSEIETRAHRLPPRLRSALIVVDGKRDTAALAGLILQDAEGTLRWLFDEGFVEAVPGAPAPAAAAPARPSAAPAPAAPAASPASVGAAPAAAPTMPFEQRRRESVRALTDAVGPLGEALALKMERARQPAELEPLLALARETIANVRGRQAAADYGARFGAPPG
jgi:hypothetical protein